MDREKVITEIEDALSGNLAKVGHVYRMSLNGLKDKALKDALVLLKEQRPVKVTVRFNHTDNKCFDHYKCPSCGSTDIYYEQHYCDDCGTALDWSEIT